MGLIHLLGDVALSSPPSGQTANFGDDAESNALLVYIVVAILVPLVLIFAGLKTFAQARLHLVTTWIDYYYVFSLLSGFVYMGLVVYLVSGRSFSYHAWDVQIKDLTFDGLIVSLITSIIIFPIMFLVKLNLFLLFLQVFKVVSWLQILTYIGMVATFVLYMTVMALNVFYCTPRMGQAFADYLLAMDSPQCLNNIKPTAVVGAALNIAVDVYIMAIPLPAVVALHLPLRRKLGVVAIFLTGSLACVASILALVYKIRLYTNNDNTWDATAIHATGCLEIAVGLIIPCMPSASKVFHHICPRARNWLRSTGYGNSLAPVHVTEDEERSNLRRSRYLADHGGYSEQYSRDATLMEELQDWPINNGTREGSETGSQKTRSPTIIEYPPKTYG